MIFEGPEYKLCWNVPEGTRVGRNWSIQRWNHPSMHLPICRTYMDSLIFPCWKVKIWLPRSFIDEKKIKGLNEVRHLEKLKRDLSWY